MMRILCGVLLVVAGCGAGGTPTAGGSSALADPAVVWNDFVACARTHGQPRWPDAQVKADGTASFGDFPAKGALESVREACGAILDRLPPNARPRTGEVRPPTPEHMAAMNAYTKCMREHGFDDWPDVNADGTFWTDEQFWTPEHRAKQQLADPQCRQLLPSE